MRKLALIWAIVSAVIAGGATAAYGTTAVGGEVLAIQDVQLTIPDGWSLRQDTRDGGMMIFGFENGNDYLTLYVKQATGLDMKGIFANDVRITRDIASLDFGKYGWKTLETSKTSPVIHKTSYITSFMAEHAGHSYYGYARSDVATHAREIVTAFLTGIN